MSVDQQPCLSVRLQTGKTKRSETAASGTINAVLPLSHDAGFTAVS